MLTAVGLDACGQLGAAARIGGSDRQQRSRQHSYHSHGLVVFLEGSYFASCAMGVRPPISIRWPAVPRLPPRVLMGRSAAGPLTAP